ncbi:PQQ-binding-like beta-propeller repeat protein [Streptomyces sp. NPDC050856]|uniref:outer membrane protein assembly factor BamB family protein n=1 Tax=Streptomyces sp. NPDC050856 TaxID=3154939 RepID=UPI0033DF3ADE
MTQPPPPPNQPPGPPPNQPPGPPPQGGGFGAPQDPPPGFGAPTPPPQNPGYGHPQTPPQPPGYGYPQTPHGYPQAPGQQQPGYGHGYGYPTAPVRQPVPPQGGGRRLSTQAQIIIAAAVAVVLIIAAGVWYAAGSGDDPADDPKASAGATGGGQGGGAPAPDGAGEEEAPDNPRAKVAFQLPQPKITDTTDVNGSWITDKVFVKPGVNSIVGYDIARGTQLWTIPLPGQVCAASRHVKDNKTAFAFEAAKRVPPKNFEVCTEVAALDLAAGKLLWTKSTTGGKAGDRKVRFSEVTVGGGTVAAGGSDGGAAWDLATGKERWKPVVDSESCYDMGYGGGENLVAARKCGPYGSQWVTIQNLDPATGTPVSSFKMPTGVNYAAVVSTKPLVVAANVGDTATDGSGISDLFSVDEKTGKLKVKIAVDSGRFDGRCPTTEVEGCRRVVVGNGRVYLPTDEHEGAAEYGNTNEIVSFDLTTGKPTSDRADAGERYSMWPLRMDGGDIIAYKTPPYDKGGQIVSIDGATFKQTVLLENPGDKSVRDAERAFTKDYAEMRYAGGRLFISQSMLSRPSSVVPDEKRYLAVSYTTN